jgi:hypothetical protein
MPVESQCTPARFVRRRNRKNGPGTGEVRNHTRFRIVSFWVTFRGLSQRPAVAILVMLRGSG